MIKDGGSFPIDIVYSQDIELRTYAKYEMIKNIPEMGWRSSKTFYLVKDNSDVKTEKLLTWTRPGIDFTMDQRTLASLQKSLSQLQVRFLQEIIKITD